MLGRLGRRFGFRCLLQLVVFSVCVVYVWEYGGEEGVEICDCVGSNEFDK